MNEELHKDDVAQLTENSHQDSVQIDPGNEEWDDVLCSTPLP